LADNIKIESIGIKEIITSLEKKANASLNVVRDILIEASGVFLDTIRFIAPRATGNYADSWVIQNISDKSVTIGTPHQDLFIYLEYGTAPHPIVGHRKILHWVENGQDHFAFWVRHPGFAAMPHLRPAINVLEVKLPEIVKKHMDKVIMGK